MEWIQDDDEDANKARGVDDNNTGYERGRDGDVDDFTDLLAMPCSLIAWSNDVNKV